MADWETVAIATITALAGISGSVIAGQFRIREQAKSHRRDDASLIRSKVEDLFSELDAIQAASSQQMVAAVEMLNRKEVVGKPFEKFNLGKTRSLATLYFPALAAALNAYDTKCDELILQLRSDLQNEDMDNMTAMYGHVILAGQITSNLCNEVRQLLNAEAAQVGASIRNSISSVI